MCLTQGHGDIRIRTVAQAAHFIFRAVTDFHARQDAKAKLQDPGPQPVRAGAGICDQVIQFA